MVLHSSVKRFESSLENFRREKNDHRKIGKELELFTTNQDVGAGLPYGCQMVL